METPHRRRTDREPPDQLAVTPGPGMIATGPAHDAIARRAYELYEQRGRRDGQDQEDWFQAERELSEQADSRSSIQELMRTGAAVAV